MALSCVWRGTMVAEMPEPQDGALLLRLEGFEGPLDLLLELARGQKVDLATISILSLVEQFLAVVEGVRAVRLELAADWLVMAAWLTWLKSRLLLPASPAEAEEGELAGEALAERLAHLQAMQRLAAWLADRPQVGQEVFIRGMPENFTDYDRSRLKLDVAGLVGAYLSARRRGGRRRIYRPKPVSFWSVKDALGRLEKLVGSLPDWTSLEQFIPQDLLSPLERKAALASTLIAGLEMARHGAVRLRQEAPFGPILLRGEGQMAEDTPEETESNQS
ncbi:Segregation and condensation protein ScpA [Granulibacter bethesdensis]|uniref:Segregation and condensation protein A n=2 Tax=Granulibacter bethesdensis TaxID=364410 RepID=A0AAC9KAC5_9PROT|nr:Segregation and condensation protein ScpA [Granulibacter bethesdensis]APH62140.1 Segregation and condensation protein ScpA [Granulibacter bethesdensis]